METVSLSLQGEGKRLVYELGRHLRWLMDRAGGNLRWFEVWIRLTFTPRGWGGSSEVMAVWRRRFEQTVEQSRDNCGMHPFHLGLHSQHAQKPGHTLRHTHTHSNTDYWYQDHKSVHNYITAWGDDATVSVSRRPNNCKNNRAGDLSVCVCVCVCVCVSVQRLELVGYFGAIFKNVSVPLHMFCTDTKTICFQYFPWRNINMLKCFFLWG